MSDFLAGAQASLRFASTFLWTSTALLSIQLSLAQDVPPPAASPAPAAQPAGPPPKLDEVLQGPDLWSRPLDAFKPALQALKFAWTSSAQDTARSVSPQLALGSQKVGETLFRFQDGKLAEATLYCYSRGNEGDIAERTFDDRLAALQAELTKLLNTQPKPLGRNMAGAARAEGCEWETADSEYLLEWSVTRGSKVKLIPFRAEFIRLTVRPKTDETRAIGAATPANTLRDAVRKFSGRDHIVRLPSGDVKITDVPMVDQGDKGYCVVASVERIMRYFGAPVDQNELAQIANSDRENGTSFDSMAASLNRLSARLGVKVRPTYNWDIKEFLAIIDAYNRATKRGKVAPEIQLGSGQIISVESCLRQAQPDLFKEVRLKKTADFGKFQREIQRSVDEGMPLLWSVQIGLVKEKELSPQAFGGHMRLIIGYNLTTKEILYSDSWGAGHEEKRMTFEDAWAMTTGLSTVQPIGT